MYSYYDLCQGIQCQLIIQDLTEAKGEYLDPRNPQQENRFKYLDTYTVDLLLLNKADDSYEISDVIITSHIQNASLVQAITQLRVDGWYTLHHMIMPSKEWLEELILARDPVLKTFKSIIVTDGELFYRYKDGEIFEIDADNLIVESLTKNTTVIKSIGNYFSTCFLWKCYINLCKEILKYDINECFRLNPDLKELIYRRDFLWATIQTVQFLIQQRRFKEAEALLEDIEGCNGFCRKYRAKEQQIECCEEPEYVPENKQGGEAEIDPIIKPDDCDCDKEQDII